MRIATQVLDCTYGQSAVGVHARLERSGGASWTAIAEAVTNDEGYIGDWKEGRHLERGLYRIVFDSDSYFASLGASTAYPEVVVIFRMPEAPRTFQVRVMLSPYSYSVFFGNLDTEAGKS
jgi:5-hydroxyisourate hydrolase